MRSHVPLAIAGFVLFQFVFVADGLKCVQCGGANQMSCPSELPSATECPMGVKHCRKIVQDASLIVAESRACAMANEDISDGCSGSGMAKICTYYCDTDGCNSAPNLFSRQGHWIAMCAAVLTCLFVNKGIF